MLKIEVILPDGTRFESATAGLLAFADTLETVLPASVFSRTTTRELRNYLDTVARAMRQRHSLKWAPFKVNPEGERGGRMNRRTGNLLKAIESSVRVTTQGQGIIVGSIGGGSLPKWAIVHEEGATIKPKRASYLTVPLPAALDSRGVPKKRRARDWPNTFVATSKKGNLIIFQRRGKNIIPLYVLKKSVRIPPRLGLGKTIELTQGAFVDTLFEKLTQEVLRRASGG